MIEIKLSKYNHNLTSRELHGNKRTRIFVDEDEIVWQNGIGLAKGKIVSEYSFGKDLFKAKTFTNKFLNDIKEECYGLINNNYEELFAGKSEDEKKLMFYEANKMTIHAPSKDCTEWNYIVSQKDYYSRDLSSFYHAHHVKYILGNSPVTIESFGEVIPTGKKNLFIASSGKNGLIKENYTIYDTLLGRNKTRVYSSITSIPDNINSKGNEFLIYDKVCSFVPGCKESPVGDTLIFKIDENDNINSPIYSCRLNKHYINSVPLSDYGIIKSLRENELNVLSIEEQKILEKNRNNRKNAEKVISQYNKNSN